MILALLTTAPATAAAAPSQGVISMEDYPPAALRRGEQGPVYFEVVVNPQGRVDSCSILLSSGSSDLDDASCRIVTARARFSPAQDETGRPIYSTYRQLIYWRIANYPSPTDVPLPPQMPPDFDLTLNQAPAGVKLPLQFKVSYFVKANGTASHCQASDAGKPPPQVLVELACKAVMQPAVKVIRNRNNEPVDGADCETVRFSVDNNKR